ncbi:MAG TPA: hypothetical protein VII93_10195 [Anaerolineales bacterium]
MSDGTRDPWPGNIPSGSSPLAFLSISSHLIDHVPNRKGNTSGPVDQDISQNTPAPLIDIQISQVKTSYLLDRYGKMQIIYTSK